jgi:broad specificity phosphatase PhoE
MFALVRSLGLLGWAALAAEPFPVLPSPPAAGLRVYLVRHGQAFSNLNPEPDLSPEQLDHLTDLGKRQSDAAGAALAGRGISVVLTSPASRARETAERLARSLGVPPPQVETRLRPLELGRRPNGPALDWDARISEWEAGRDPSPEGGESMGGMGDRVADLIASLLADAKGRAGPARSLVLVAHGEVLGAYLGRVRGTPPAKRYPHGFGNASITVVDVAGEGARERLANYRPDAP